MDRLKDADYNKYLEEIEPLILQLKKVCRDNNYSMYNIIVFNDNEQKAKSDYILPEMGAEITPSLVREHIKLQLGIASNNNPFEVTINKE